MFYFIFFLSKNCSQCIKLHFPISFYLLMIQQMSHIICLKCYFFFCCFGIVCSDNQPIQFTHFSVRFQHFVHHFTMHNHILLIFSAPIIRYQTRSIIHRLQRLQSMSSFIHIKILNVTHANIAVEHSCKEYPWVYKPSREIVSVYLSGKVVH